MIADNNNKNDLSPFQSTVLENNLNVLSSDQENSSSSSFANVTNNSSSSTTSITNSSSFSSGSASNTNSSSPYAALTQSSPPTLLEPSRDNVVTHEDSSKINPASSLPSPSPSQSSSLASSKDEMLVGDSQPVGTEQALKREHSLAEDVKSNENTKKNSDNEDDQKKTFRKKQIKILILNGDEEIPDKLKSDKRVHVIDTDTELDQHNAFKKELCNGVGYIKCLERSSFEGEEEQNHPHLGSPTPSHVSPEMTDPLHEHSSYRAFDSEPYHGYEDEFPSRLNGAKKENYGDFNIKDYYGDSDKENSKYHESDDYSNHLNDASKERDYNDFNKKNYDRFTKERNYDDSTTTSNIMADENLMNRYYINRHSSNEDEERDAQNMEFAIQSAAAEAARSNRLKSYAHEQSFLNGHVGARMRNSIESGRREGSEDNEDVYSFKRNRNLKWKKKMNETVSVVSLVKKQRG